MSFELFNYAEIKDKIRDIINNQSDNLKKIQEISSLHNNIIPQYLINYIINFLPEGNNSIAIHQPKSIEGYTGIDVDKNNILRSRGFIGKRELEEKKYPKAIHHINILFNNAGNARVFYKYQGSIKFLRTERNDQRI